MADKSGGTSVSSSKDVNIGGDVTGRDKITHNYYSNDKRYELALEMGLIAQELQGKIRHATVEYDPKSFNTSRRTEILLGKEKPEDVLDKEILERNPGMKFVHPGLRFVFMTMVGQYFPPNPQERRMFIDKDSSLWVDIAYQREIEFRRNYEAVAQLRGKLIDILPETKMILGDGHNAVALVNNIVANMDKYEIQVGRYFRYPFSYYSASGPVKSIPDAVISSSDDREPAFNEAKVHFDALSKCLSDLIRLLQQYTRRE